MWWNQPQKKRKRTGRWKSTTLHLIVERLDVPACHYHHEVLSFSSCAQSESLEKKRKVWANCLFCCVLLVVASIPSRSSMSQHSIILMKFFTFASLSLCHCHSPPVLSQNVSKEKEKLTELFLNDQCASIPNRTPRCPSMPLSSWSSSHLRINVASSVKSGVFVSPRHSSWVYSTKRALMLGRNWWHEEREKERKRERRKSKGRSDKRINVTSSVKRWVYSTKRALMLGRNWQINMTRREKEEKKNKGWSDNNNIVWPLVLLTEQNNSNGEQQSWWQSRSSLPLKPSCVVVHSLISYVMERRHVLGWWSLRS